MATTTVVRRAEVAAVTEIAFPDYRGPQHAVRVTERHCVTSADLCWSGGSRSRYAALRRVPAGDVGALDLAPAWQRVELSTVSPWAGDRWEGPIPDDVILVEHRVSCGKDLGLRYYVSPTSGFLPLLRLASAATALTASQETVLRVLCTIVSSYRQEEYRRAGLLLGEESEAVDGLVALGLAKRSRAGAVGATIEGKNAWVALRQ